MTFKGNSATVRKILMVRRYTLKMLASTFIFLVTIAAIVISINADIFKQYDNPSLNKYDFTNPWDILKFAKEQNQGSRSGLANTMGFGEAPSPKHIFLVDITGSSKRASLDSLKKSLKEFVYVENSTRISEDSRLNPLSSEILIALGAICEVEKKDSIPLLLLKGYDKSFDPLTSVVLDDGGINDEFLNVCMNGSANTNGSKTYFDDVFKSQSLRDFIEESGSHLVLTIISDFIHEVENSQEHSLDDVDEAINEFRELVVNEVGQEGSLRLNLLSLPPSDKFIDKDKYPIILPNIIKTFQESAYVFNYDLNYFQEKFKDITIHETLDIKFSELITSVHFTETSERNEFPPSDLMLHNPKESISLKYRLKVNTYENEFNIDPGYYFISNKSDFETWIKSGDDKHLVKSSGIERIYLEDNFSIYQNSKLSEDFKFSKFDIYSEKLTLTQRFHLWQVDSLTTTGSFFYSYCVYFSIVSVGTAVFLIVFSLLFPSKEWREKKWLVFIEFGLSLSVCILFVSFLFDWWPTFLIGWWPGFLLAGGAFHLYWYWMASKKKLQGVQSISSMIIPDENRKDYLIK